MADTRYYAKMDLGYYSNPKWYRLERSMRTAMPNALHSALRSAMRTAQAAHSASIYYACEHRTDGIFPVEAIKRMVGVVDDLEEAAITALFDVGMWINHPLGEAEIRDFLDHQEASTRSQSRSNGARKAAEARWAKDAQRNAKRNAECNAKRNADEMRGDEIRNTTYSSSEVADATPRRDDVDQLLDYLDAAIVANGSKPPSRTKKNHDAMRLLLDKDKRAPDQICKAIDFATSDGFWRANILSADKLRAKYDQLRLHAQRGQRTGERPNRVQENLAIVQRIAARESAEQARLEITK